MQPTPNLVFYSRKTRQEAGILNIVEMSDRTGIIPIRLQRAIKRGAIPAPHITIGNMPRKYWHASQAAIIKEALR